MPDTDLTSALDAIRDRRARSTSYVSARDLPDGDNRSAASAADVPRLLAAVDAVLARHVPKTVTVTRLCGAHHRIVIPDCPDCVKRQVTTCAACDPVCPDDNTWPCADYLAISRELTGEDGTDG
jgi:hypothetical protein